MKKIILFLICFLVQPVAHAFSFPFPIQNHSHDVLDKGEILLDVKNVVGTLSSTTIIPVSQAELLINAEGDWSGLVVFTYHIENGHPLFDNTVTAYYDPRAQRPVYIHCSTLSGLRCEATPGAFVITSGTTIS